MSMIRTFILPILTYGLEIVLPKGKNLDNINRQYKKWIKQILAYYSYLISKKPSLISIDLHLLFTGKTTLFVG
jgi:hypothetical protein